PFHLFRFRHSQTTRIPSCPSLTRKLWEGYSFLSMTGSERAHVNDLASPGSCLQLFNPIPFMFCEKQENCYYAQRNDRSYWLSTEEEPMNDGIKSWQMNTHEIRFVVVVCEAPSKLYAFHAQTLEIPKCPDGWSTLWPGNSFLMVSFRLVSN
ncbi:hypothetical protein AHF37_11365, partial [Paragonimus kellicotti]